jgi:hypothetical protein
MSEQNAVIQRPASAVAEAGELSVGDLVAQVSKIQQVMSAVMKENLHYGKIPGCGDKPTLLKPGAEKLALLFRLCPTFDVTLTEFPGGHREYRVLCTLTHIPTGAMIAQGVGSGSTMEAKYRYRGGERKCPECGKPTIKKSKFPPRGKPNEEPGFYCYEKIGGCGKEFAVTDKEITGQSTGRTENPDIADTFNTVLKMAKKRAQVDATLSATGASDIFAQDLEDLAETAATLKTPPAAEKAQTPEDGAREMGDAFDEANPPPKKPKGTKKLIDALLLSMDKAQTIEDVKACWSEAAKYAWTEDEFTRLEDRKEMRKSDFAAAEGK